MGPPTTDLSSSVRSEQELAFDLLDHVAAAFRAMTARCGDPPVPQAGPERSVAVLLPPAESNELWQEVTLRLLAKVQHLERSLQEARARADTAEERVILLEHRLCGREVYASASHFA